MMTTPKKYLFDMELDEVSTVIEGDNPTADILIFKSGSETCECDTYTGTEDGKCEQCGKPDKEMSKMLPGPQALHANRTLDDEDFKYKKTMRKRKGMRRMKKDSTDAIKDMADAQRRRIR